MELDNQKYYILISMFPRSMLPFFCPQDSPSKSKSCTFFVFSGTGPLRVVILNSGSSRRTTIKAPSQNCCLLFPVCTDGYSSPNPPPPSARSSPACRPIPQGPRAGPILRTSSWRIPPPSGCSVHRPRRLTRWCVLVPFTLSLGN